MTSTYAGIAGALALVACVSSDADVCPSGARCAEGTRCVVVEMTELCAETDALAECDGRAPGDSCDDGRCYEAQPGPVCLTARCGNGFVERHEEACDDGNNASLDGCAGDCRSDETCGNGVLDSSRGELCDDGNLRSHDGCASTCALESLEWLNAEQNLTVERSGFAVVFDTRRNEAVAFAGKGVAGVGLDLSDIRTWGQGILAKRPALGSGPSPVGRSFSAMTFDDARGVVVVFGGDPGLADTWEWNGRAWRFREVAGPPVRSGHVMAYDRARRRTVMFGGRQDVVASSDTWEWDGEQWHRRSIAGAPSGETARAAAYDASTGRTVVITSEGTWTYDGTTWTAVSSSPLDATNLSAAFDTRRQQVLALGVAPGGVAHLWAFDGQTWIDLGGNASIGASVLTYDPTRQRAIAWGPGELGAPLRIHEWDGSTWTSMPTTATLPPTGLAGAAGVHDYLHRRAVVFGGKSASSFFDDVWMFDGVAWSKAAPSTTPGARADHAMAYDATRDEIVLFGGRDAAGVRADTWVWSGDTWTPRTTPAAPPARQGHAMAYDPARERVVLFGGSSSVALRVPLTDTWEWDGTAWTEVPGTVHPTLSEGSLAYDRAARTLTYFDGATTWTYDGTWRAAEELVSPTTREQATMAWDPSRARLVIYGGVSTGGQFLPTLGDLWEWYSAFAASTTASWRRMPAQIMPRRGHVSLPNPDGAGLLTVYGDGDGITAAPLPAIVSWRGAAPEENCIGRLDGDDDGLAGCADPDCWASCAPACVGDLACEDGPRCGDGSCSAMETPAICPADCGPAPVICGDAVCDPGETCVGDCG